MVKRRGYWVGLLLLVVLLVEIRADDAVYDLVIKEGRVMDPESGLDAVRWLGIDEGKIVAISEESLKGRTYISAAGLVVAPGFIDLHQHAQDPETYWRKVQDGVTSALELEVGTAEVDDWYDERKGRLPIHHGVSVGHIHVRMKVMGDEPGFLPAGDDLAVTQQASPDQIVEMKREIERGLKEGAVGVGFGIGYTPVATRWEILEMFRVAGDFGACCHVHLRGRREKAPGSSIEGLGEVIAASVVSGAALHVVHIQSTGGPVTQELLQMVAAARERGLDVTAECYPYTAGMTDLSSAIFNPGWRDKFKLDYDAIQWPSTGERLTAETFAKYRKQGGLIVLHANTEKVVADAIKHPLTMIASDGLKGHPRNAGTFARVLGRYVRERKDLDLMQALRKITLMPAQRLENRVPEMKNKGRVRVEADADLTIFDPEKIIDQATYTDAMLPSKGIEYVLVSGVPVVIRGMVDKEKLVGKAIRAAISSSN